MDMRRPIRVGILLGYPRFGGGEFIGGGRQRDAICKILSTVTKRKQLCLEEIGTSQCFQSKRTTRVNYS